MVNSTKVDLVIIIMEDMDSKAMDINQHMEAAVDMVDLVVDMVEQHLPVDADIGVVLHKDKLTVAKEQINNKVLLV